ncbi:huntingtin-associated protein 1 [Nothoprocta perdicaria]|uniref:huntingtin-associated protein 1 n=1 Tax=Nothoprocta perdicaria TaxID=30464 RepID=UPI000E1BAA25|nr:huntingtin-associated protein 1 [Nothoprocta perdicaria]
MWTPCDAPQLLPSTEQGSPAGAGRGRERRAGRRAAPHGRRPPDVTPAKLDIPPERPPAQPARAPAPRRDAATITDLHSGGDVPEVEIVSLLGEPLPRYTLRADSVFGYEHDDWLRAPPLPPGAAAALTPRQLEETLRYFVLCAERVSRVTKTYHDIDAVTNLLEEKERDLELAARIGQSLLKQNRSLTERNELLEEQLELAKEEIAQLRHEVSMRDDLLHFYTTSTEESEPGSAASTPLRRSESSPSLQHYLQYDVLQQKLKGLEEENQKLRLEATSIATETCQYEEQEQQLMIDCVEQFSEASRQVSRLSEELARKAEDTARQQEEISQLLAQVVELQHKCRTYGSEVEELQQHLALAKEVQQQLRTELRDLQEKYAECGGMLQEARAEVKSLRSRSLPSGAVGRYGAPSLLPLDSLAAEIKGSMRKGAEGSSSDYSCLRVFETVKAVNQAARARSSCESQPSGPSSAGTSTPHGSGPGPAAGARAAAAGAALEAAVQQLSVRQESHAAERSFFDTEREHKLRRLHEAEGSSGALSPTGSVASAGSGASELTAASGFSLGSLSYLPDKLQIVKPLEGSVTLHHWQQLARPDLGGILVPRPGVLTKDFRQLDVDLEQVYTLADLEEDDVDAGAFARLPTSTPAPERRGVFLSVNNLPQTPSTFTITTCHVLHPTTESTRVTASLPPAAVPSCGPFAGLSGGAEPPRAPTGLVPLLLARGISAGRPPAPGSIFSLNLVAKLRRLGLDRVVARGETSYAQGAHGDGAT